MKSEKINNDKKVISRRKLDMLFNNSSIYYFNNLENYYEFEEFVKIFENKDFDRANQMMEKSLIAMTIATQARQSAGVVFTADQSL